MTKCTISESNFFIFVKLRKVHTQFVEQARACSFTRDTLLGTISSMDTFMHLSSSWTKPGIFQTLGVPQVPLF